MPVFSEITELASVYPADCSDGYEKRVVSEREERSGPPGSFSDAN
jgi:hypothetical protein